MPMYHQLGQVPNKRHVVFRRPDGALYAEELIGNKGFEGPSSLLYHVHQPTHVKTVRRVRDLNWEADPDGQFRHRHFRTHQLASGGSITLDRVPLLFNTDVALLFVQPDREDDFFYRNAQGDEIVYVSDGAGVLQTQLGAIPFSQGDYLVIPRGIMHRYTFTGTPVRCLVVESRGYVRTPKRYRNEHGQLTEMSPFSERDIRRPTDLPTHDARGEHKLVVKKDDKLHELILAWHPFDVVGLGRLLLPVGVQHQQLRAARRPGAPPAAGASDLRGRQLRRVLVLPAAVRLRRQRGAGAVQPLERDVGRGDLLRQLGVHEP